jgi:thrombospondin motif-containing protein 9
MHKFTASLFVFLFLQIESSGNGHHPQLSLEYYQLSREEETNNNKSLDYSWVYGEFSDCSVTCGSGVQVSHAHCQDAEFPEKVLPENFCNKSSKPYPIVIKCSRPLCLPRWKVSEWSLCTAICGGGSQERLVECVQIDDQETENILLPESCDQATRPPQRRECNTHSCGKWKISKWSDCNPSCGEGMKHRLVQCIDDDQNIIDKANCPLPVPSRSIPCFNGLCHFTWQAGSWEQCSSSCGTGTQNRLVTCATHSGEVVNSSKCPNSTKPLDARECFSSENCAKQWISKPWGQCEGPCGFTHQYRNVSCYGIVNGEMYLLPEASCDSLKKPPTERSCNKTGCPYWQTSSWSFCSTTCGEGQQTRTVQCVKSDGQITTGCHISTKPPEVTSCSLKPCGNIKPCIACKLLPNSFIT